MKIHPGIVLLFLTAWLGVQGWALSEISALKVEVATLTMRMNYQFGDIGNPTKIK